MKACGIIVEYNPMHQGHIHHLQEAKRITGCDVLVVILSSYFSQRALPSLIDPYHKSQLAIQYGADLVIELPAVYAAQSADQFAKYAIESLASIGVKWIVFGSETNKIETLTNILHEVESQEKDPSKSWAQNSAYALEPNDILGIQYIKYCQKYGIIPLSIKRSAQFKSATQTRKDYFEKRTNEFLSEYFILNQQWSSYYPYLRLFLLMSDPSKIEQYFLVSEGIEYRLVEAAKKERTWEGFLSRTISKTYTRARIQRVCLFIMLQIEKQEMKNHDHFSCAIVLGFNGHGRQYLKEIDRSRVYTRFRALPPFLKRVHLKSKFLYESIMEQNIKDTIYVL